ncbi:hypothetical protein EVAR_14267_1 [Eumeta japonica]|uniref:Uncharacterized protein n=1 Tax=Eumeta variegata TaxID=151549 RepID=A0A4C1WC78_EUMVA|nr:hypothetical protein EVAR_14267_1 [Eumeta japonica]
MLFSDVNSGPYRNGCRYLAPLNDYHQRSAALLSNIGCSLRSDNTVDVDVKNVPRRARDLQKKKKEAKMAAARRPPSFVSIVKVSFSMFGVVSF